MNYNAYTSVFVTTKFVGFHRWPDAPEATSYLRNLHRHLFGVRVEVGVTGLDREVEYHDLLAHVNAYIANFGLQQPEGVSCEVMATDIVRWISKAYPDRYYYSVTVDEDGENGSTVELRA